MALVSLNANDIDNAGVAVDAELPVAWLDAELGDAQTTARGPGRLTARVSRSGNDMVVRGRVVVSVSTPCARCLDPAPVDVDTELALLLKPVAVPKGKKGAARAVTANTERAAGKGAPAAPPSSPRRRGGRAGGGDLQEYEFSSIEADTDTFDGETVVLDPFVREAILLELPNFPLCSEECAGIRAPAVPAFGRSGGTPVDPRLAPLGALRAKLASMSGDGAALDEGGSASLAGASNHTRREQPVARKTPPQPRSKNGPKLKANAAPRPKKKRK
jgi:uncharacterized protein